MDELFLSRMNLININNETILPIVLYGDNRGNKMVQYHKRVMVDFLQIPMNYVKCNFPGFSHGNMVNQIIKDTIDTIKPDYFFFCDFDNIFLNKDVLNQMRDSVKYKNTIWGCATQSNHKKGPDGFISHPYCSQACLCFSTELYKNLGSPDMDHWSEQSEEYGGDTCERLTYLCKQNGYSINLLYPSSSIVSNCSLDNGIRFGRGNYYGPKLVYHQMQNNQPESENEFIKVCEDVLNGKYE